ncbi:positive regulation of ryanodine-sensitive calcium-release channel [Branchiostoma belcheri]|nr:positive regulation of ryanodine-sensitive calcium-release channel [Branchiostoma belcheri]
MSDQTSPLPGVESRHDGTTCSSINLTSSFLPYSSACPALLTNGRCYNRNTPLPLPTISTKASEGGVPLEADQENSRRPRNLSVSPLARGVMTNQPSPRFLTGQAERPFCLTTGVLFKVSPSRMSTLLGQTSALCAPLPPTIDLHWFNRQCNISGASAGKHPTESQQTDPPSWPRLKRVLRLALPVQALLFLVFLLVSLLPLMWEPECCTTANNLHRSIHPTLRHINGPSPT